MSDRPRIHELLDQVADAAEALGQRPRDFLEPDPPYGRAFLEAWSNPYGYRLPDQAIDWFLWSGGIRHSTRVFEPYSLFPHSAPVSIDLAVKEIHDVENPADDLGDLREFLSLLHDDPVRQVWAHLPTGQVWIYAIYAVMDPRGFGMVAESIEEFLELELRLHARGCVFKEEHTLLYGPPLDGLPIDYPEVLDFCGRGSIGRL